MPESDAADRSTPVAPLATPQGPRDPGMASVGFKHPRLAWALSVASLVVPLIALAFQIDWSHW